MHACAGFTHNLEAVIAIRQRLARLGHGGEAIALLRLQWGTLQRSGCFVPLVAFRAYRESLAIAERLAAADPSNAGWQRDLVASCWRMADISERTGQDDAQAWWRKAYDTLNSMKLRGIMLPTDAQHLEVLRQKAGG